MKSPKHSLRKIVTFLNNPDEEGGFWLPNIQRPFVWKDEQICRLFDSILREYPISTLLVWKTKSTIRHRKFIDNYHSKIRLTDFYVPDNTKKKCLVLDGQQRLQSLFIGLCGSYEGRELYIDILSGEVSAPDDLKYRFAFLNPAETEFPWILFKEIVFSSKNMLVLSNSIITSAARVLQPKESEKVAEHISIIFKTFHSDDGIAYQELDSTENQDLYTEDDVVEIFIRANSGGTRLGKSDLLFSLLTSTWNDADAQMEALLGELNAQGFAFERDFVLKACLTLLDQGAQYQVPKFRKPEVRKEIEDKWDQISAAIMDVYDFVRSHTYIRDDRAMPSYLVLIPLIYFRYHYQAAWKLTQGMDTYLIRSLLTGAFSGTPDRLIDDVVKKINELQAFDLGQMFDVIRSQGRSLELTPDRFWQMGYGSDSIHLLFSLWYPTFNYAPAFNGNAPQVDHIFPQSALRRVKAPNPETGRSGMKYLEADRNQLANCMLLTQGENGPAGKTDKLPEIWFADKSPQYLAMHLIPTDPHLWKLDQYEDFVEARKKLIQDKFSQLLVDKAST
jgi:hypothetical protein